MLHCAAMSGAGGTVNIEWSFRGQAVGGRERFELLSSHDLLVTMTSPEDSGQYTCTARDEFGVSSTSAFVRILRKSSTLVAVLCVLGYSEWSPQVQICLRTNMSMPLHPILAACSLP